MASQSSKPSGWASRVLIALVWCYRFTLRGLVGNQCRFQPSCSEYAIQAITHHGAIKGFGLSAHRICRCHPWSEGGFDPIPSAKSLGRLQQGNDQK